MKKSRTTSIVTAIFGLAATLLARNVHTIVDVDLSSTLRGGAAAGISMTDTGGDTSGDNGDDTRKSKKSRMSNKDNSGASTNPLKDHWLFQKIIADTSDRGNLLKICHEQLVNLKDNLENFSTANISVLTAYDSKKDRYRLTLSTLISPDETAENLLPWSYYKTEIWFNKDGTISLDHHANQSIDLGYWDKIQRFGINDHHTYSVEEHLHRYAQLNTALASTAIWIVGNPKWQVHDDIIKPILDDFIQDAKIAINKTFTALNQNELPDNSQLEERINRSIVKALEHINPNLKLI